VLLYSLIKERNPNAHLEISNLIDHGDLKVSFKIFREIVNLAKAFGHFIVNIPQKQAPSAKK
jgi:hypothetical protein